MGLAESPSANFALISTPGDYAAAEAMKALRLGLNVMLFSDNVSIARRGRAEARGARTRADGHGPGLRHGDHQRRSARLRQRGPARRHRRRRRVGHRACSRSPASSIDSAKASPRRSAPAATTCSREVGGITMLQGLAALAADATTKVIVLDLQAAGARGRGRGCSPQAARGAKAGGRELPRRRSEDDRGSEPARL